MEPIAGISGMDRITLIASGWNNEIYQIGDKYVLKIPLKRENENQLEFEIRVSEFISGKISDPVPVFVYSGRMNNGTFVAMYEKLGGVNITNTTYGRQEDRITPSELDSARREEFYMDISRILVEMKSIAFPDMGGFPVRVGVFLINHYKEMIRRSHDLLDDLLDRNTMRAVEREFQEALKPELFNFSPCFIHGDLGGWNILYDEITGNISGIIDWGNSSFSDPALDYSELVYDYGPEFSSFFMKHFNDHLFKMDNSFMRRTAFYIRISGVIDALYGIENHIPSYVKKGIGDIEMKFTP